MKKNGNFCLRKSNHRKIVINEKNETNVSYNVVHNPQINVLDREHESDINRRSVLRIITRHKFHPFLIILYQELHDTNFMNRIAFCL